MTRTVNLRADAEAEVRRLTVVRSLDRTRHERANDTVGADGALIARARGARRRAALAGRTLFMWQVACEDAAGRRLPAAIVAILVSIDLPAGGMSQLRNLVDAIDADPPDAVRRALSAMQRDIVDSGRAQAMVRLERERTIAADGAHAPRSAAYQAGLFDRRSDRDQERRNCAAQHAEGMARERVAAAAAATTITALRPTLLLVLTAGS